MALAFAATAVLVSGCENVPVSVGNTPAQQQSAQPGTGANPSANPGTGATFATGDDLKLALEAVGITDVHPIVTPDKLGAWASVPAIKGCPVFVLVTGGTDYTITHMLNAKDEIVPLSLEGTPLSPTAGDLAKLLLTDPATYRPCVTNQAPTSWPVVAP
jgi:hypothetical protein